MGTVSPTLAPPSLTDEVGQGPSMGWLLARGAGAAVWTHLAGLAVVAAPVLLAWVSAGADEPFGDALSVAAIGWLLGLGGTVSTPDASWSLTPLGLTLVLLVLAYRGGLWAAEQGGLTTGTRLGALLASAGVTAAVLGGVTAAGLTLQSASVDPGEAAVHAAAVCVLGAATGVLTVQRQVVAKVRSRLPSWMWGALRPAVGALATLVAVAGAVTTTMLVFSFGRITSLLEQIDPGVAGLVALLLVCLAYLPTLVVWALAVLVGPGVSLGSAVSVSATDVTSGALPGFPLLAGVPEAVPAWLWPLGVVAVLGCGVIAGTLAARGAAGRRWEPAATGALAGLLVGAAVGLATWAASGGMGPGDLAWVGAPAAATAGTVAAAMGAAAAASATVLTWRSGYSPSRDDSESLSAS